MEKETNNTNNKLMLMNDQMFSCVYTAGTNVKKFIQLTSKRHQLISMMKMSQYVLHLVESRRLPLEVTAKIVCGMGRIILHHLQNILAEAIAVHQRSTMGRRIGYGEKNVVRKMKFQLECKGDGENAASAALLPLDLGVNYDVDIQEKITEKEVIYSLESSKSITTVKNVEDITMRDEPLPTDYSTQLQMLEDNDFGECLPSEMYDFFQSDDQLSVSSAMQIMPEPTSLEDMDIELPSASDDDMVSKSSNPEHQMLPLVDTLQPVPMDTIDYDKELQMNEPIARNDSFEDTIREGNSKDISNSLPLQTDVEMVDTHITKSSVRGPKRRLLIDSRTQISSKCYDLWISNCEKFHANIKKSMVREELNAQITEHKLNDLFAKPLRPCCNSFMFVHKPTLSRKRNLVLDEIDFGKKKPSRTERLTTDVELSVHTNDDPPVQINGKEHYELEVSPNEDPHSASLEVTGQPPDMQNFLTSFTGKASEWEYLKNCQPSASEGDTGNMHESGVVSRYAVMILLDAIFKETTDRSIPFKMLQAKISNRLIGASVFAKLLELSKEKIIQLSTDANGSPDSIHKYENWDKHVK
uniref:Uncharacterized protein n=1 Tax=Anopheles culicifacies TaxID=139723 RepID=A0A182MWG5_9DIPT